MRVDLYRPLVHRSRLSVVVARAAAKQLASPQPEFIGLDVARAPAPPQQLVPAGKIDRQGGNDLIDHLILGSEYVGQFAIEAVGPHVSATLGIDQLRCDAHAIAGFANAALQNETDSKFAANLLDLGRLTFVGERRIPGDHEQPRNLGKIRDEILRHAVAEIFLLGVATHIVEREHGNGGLTRNGRGNLARPRILSRRGDVDSEHAHGLWNILDQLFSEVLERDLELVANEIPYPARYDDCTWLGKALQAGCYVDSVTIDILAFDDHITDIDSDPKLDSRVALCRAVAKGHARLYGDRTAYGLDGARKIHEQAITSPLDYPSAVLSNARLHEFIQMCLEIAKGLLLIAAHEPAVAGNICRQNRREFAFSVRAGHGVTMETPYAACAYWRSSAQAATQGRH